MGYQDAPPSYDELLQDFNDVLDRALAGERLPFAFTMLDIPLTLAVVDVARAAREGRATEETVSQAFSAFSLYAANQDTAHYPDPPRRSGKAV